MATMPKACVATGVFGSTTMVHLCFVPQEAADAELHISETGIVTCTGCGEVGQMLYKIEEVEDPPATTVKAIGYVYEGQNHIHYCDKDGGSVDLFISDSGLMNCKACGVEKQIL